MLRLLPGEKAIEARQIAQNVRACTTIWEMGTPMGVTDGEAPPPEGTTATEYSTASSTAHPAPGARPVSASGSGSGYEKAWQTDIVNLTVNSVQSNLSWSWSGGCTQSGSGSVNYYWRSGSGWEPPYNNSSGIYRICPFAQVSSQADYKNTGFCFPNTVYSHYRDILVVGYSDGGFAGGVGTVNHSGNGGCAPLYDHYKLVRVT